MDGESATLLTKIDNDLKPYVIADVPKPRKNEAVITNYDTEASLAPFCAGCDREYGRNLARDKYLQNRVNACATRTTNCPRVSGPTGVYKSRVG
jgi:hypothetical protein